MPDREPRDVLGESLRDAQLSLMKRLAWSDLAPSTRERWCENADRIIARLAEAGYRIVKEGEEG